MLADDYDGGDAAWVTGRFRGNLNAQIGSYETYDDALYGVKTFFSFSLLQRDAARSAELAASIGDIQAIEDALPYESDRRVSSDIPDGVYNVMADFGQARGTNTASILPTESHLAQQFGRAFGMRRIVAGRGVGGNADQFLQEAHLLVEVGVDPGVEVFVVVH